MKSWKQFIVNWYIHTKVRYRGSDKVTRRTDLGKVVVSQNNDVETLFRILAHHVKEVETKSRSLYKTNKVQENLKYTWILIEQLMMFLGTTLTLTPTAQLRCLVYPLLIVEIL